MNRVAGDRAVVERAIIRTASHPSRVASQGAVVQGARTSPAAVKANGVANQRAIVQRAPLRPPTFVASRVVGKDAIVQRGPLRPAAREHLISSSQSEPEEASAGNARVPPAAVNYRGLRAIDALQGDRRAHDQSTGIYPAVK